MRRTAVPLNVVVIAVALAELVQKLETGQAASLWRGGERERKGVSGSKSSFFKFHLNHLNQRSLLSGALLKLF